MEIAFQGNISREIRDMKYFLLSGGRYTKEANQQKIN